MSPNITPINVGDELEVTIEAVGSKGEGIARKDGFVLFIPNTKEGEQLTVKVTKVLRKVGFAEPAMPSPPIEEVPAQVSSDIESSAVVQSSEPSFPEVPVEGQVREVPDMLSGSSSSEEASFPELPKEPETINSQELPPAPLINEVSTGPELPPLPDEPEEPSEPELPPLPEEGNLDKLKAELPPLPDEPKESSEPELPPLPDEQETK